MNAPTHRPTSLFAAVAVGLLAWLATPAAEAQFKLDLPGGFGMPAPQVEPVTLATRVAPAAEGRPPLVVVTATIAPGYHVYSLTQPPGGPSPTVITNASPDVRLGAFRSAKPPKTEIDQEIWVGLSIEKHYQQVTWYAPVLSPTGEGAATPTVRGRVELQACEGIVSCVPLEFDFVATSSPAPLAAAVEAAWRADASSTTQPAAADATTPVVPAPREPGETVVAPEPVSLASLAPILGGALIGGLLLNLMPCVLPVIGLKVLSFAEQAGHNRGRVLAMNLAYSAGLLSVFMLLAALAAFAGYGWGELYTHAEFKIGMVVLVFAMALSFLGVWEIPIPGFAGVGAANDLQQKEGLGGAFFKGVFTTILATPCSGPFLFPVFSATLAAPTAVTFLIFGCVGLGMASPYLLIGVFPGLVRFLPKPGLWMEVFKQLMGFVLMGTVVYLFSLVADGQRLAVLATLVAVAFACWWVGRTPLTATSQQRATAWLGGVAVSAAVAWFGFTQLGPSDHELPWREFSPATLAAAQTKGATVLVDFTADWCPTCQVNSKFAINTERVRRVIEANNVTPLLADWSDRNDAVKQTLAELGSRSIPFLAIYPADRPQSPILLPDLITEEQLLEALAQAGAKAANDAADGPLEGAEVAMPTIEIGETLGGPLR